MDGKRSGRYHGESDPCCGLSERVLARKKWSICCGKNIIWCSDQGRCFERCSVSYLSRVVCPRCLSPRGTEHSGGIVIDLFIGPGPDRAGQLNRSEISRTTCSTRRRLTIINPSLAIPRSNTPLVPMSENSRPRPRSSRRARERAGTNKIMTMENRPNNHRRESHRTGLELTA